MLYLSSAQASDGLYQPYRLNTQSAGPESALAAFDVAHYWCSNVPRIYYSANAQWPASWQAINDSGIFTAQLKSVYGQPIDPDDGRLDFVGDIQYMFKGQQEPPMLASLNLDGRIQYHRFSDFPLPQTFAQRWTKLGAAAGEEEAWRASRLPELGRSQERYQQIAVMKAYNLALYLHLTLHNELVSWAELQNSGLSPHAPGTLNPLTGKPWRGDGSPNDLHYIHTTVRPTDGGVWRSSGRSHYQLWITDEQGNTPWKFT